MIYEKSLEDEIDWKVIDQLHTATNFFASTSTELKKLYFTLIAIAIPTLIKLSQDSLDKSLFISIFTLTILFWLLDSYTYFYQDKLREKMNILFNQIKKRNTVINEKDESNNKEIIIETNRTSKGRIWRSLFNNSMLLYLFMFTITIIGSILFWKDFI
ncbi:hypothetical protein [Flavobacterium chungbukense]|uniref:SMODS and SLOG-associating 2TM effector domain-containing protein n=1 Tax=Flavobacterium chungbukense TaxID=877464 RepID=A0ABP7YI49_9FLAO|nr:hypothetical protein [Flavobacterium chungbukense]MCC4920251.1 hypothetical protein [Flavobacterium chungbukense]